MVPSAQCRPQVNLRHHPDPETRRGLTPIPGILLVCFLSPACLIHDTFVPLSNDIPACEKPDSIGRTLHFPDTTVCTLTAVDLNDSILEAHIYLNDEAGESAAGWNPALRMVDTGLGGKRMVFTVGDAVLGRIAGTVTIADPAGAADTVPFAVCRLIEDPLDRLPLDQRLWLPYTPGDTTHIRVNYSSRRLSFAVDALQKESPGPVTVGMRTPYRVAGPVCCEIEFRLRDDMVSGFEAGFFASTSPDTGKYSGRFFGVFLSGEGQWTTVKCRSVNLQTDISTITYGAGMIRLERIDSTVVFSARPMGPDTLMRPITTFSFPAADSLYLHARFRADDQMRTRDCDWGNFRVRRGLLVF